MPGYRSLIIAHGVIAAIVFIGLVPAAVLIARYYSRWDRYLAIRYHIWLQVLTLFLSTVVFVTGWFAVGPRRSLTNPHHGIGLAIYVLVVFQVLWGWLSRKSEKGKVLRRVPMKLVVCNPSRLMTNTALIPETDPPMDRACPDGSRDRSDSAGPHSIRFSEIPVHSFQYRGICMAHSFLRTILSLR